MVVSPPDEELLPEVLAEPRLEPPCERVTWAPAVTVGNNPARAAATAARAPRNCAAACARVWLETETCSSSALSCGSPNISHHLPRSTASRGWAVFQPAGGASLKAPGVSTGGL